MIVGGLVLLGSACLFIYNLFMTQFKVTEAHTEEVEYAATYHPVKNLPEFLNDFTLWNKFIAALMTLSYAIPILQFFFMDTLGSSPWGY